jgi:hypothetical protein
MSASVGSGHPAESALGQPRSLFCPACETKAMKKASRILLIAAEVLFLCSLFLPAIPKKVLGRPAEWEGWRSMFVALWSLGGITGNPSLALLIVAALGNLVFLVAPLLLLRPFCGMSHRGASGAVMCALVFALLAPLSNAVRPVQLLSGYFVWLAAYAALLSSAILAGIAQTDGRARP